MVINPIVGVYIPMIRIPSLKVGGFPSPIYSDFWPWHNGEHAHFWGMFPAPNNSHHQKPFFFRRGILLVKLGRDLTRPIYPPNGGLAREILFGQILLNLHLQVLLRGISYLNPFFELFQRFGFFFKRRNRSFFLWDVLWEPLAFGKCIL